MRLLKFFQYMQHAYFIVMSGHSLWIVLTCFDKLLYPVWISLILVYINFIHGYGGDGIFTHTALYSLQYRAPPPNTRLTYDTVWFSFEGGKDTEVR
jgi:hypothetical protein